MADTIRWERYAELQARYSKAQAELAEARAQIAALEQDAEILAKIGTSHQQAAIDRGSELAEARAQIAAKDVALRAVAGWLGSDRAAYPNALACIEAALTAPARETK